jgi:hypothetical protein
VDEGSFFPHPHQHIFVGGFLDANHPNRGEVESYCGLTCISFMASNGENFFLCFLATWISCFEKALFSSVAHFFIVSLIWGELSLENSLYFLTISPLSDVE